jgi:hypothetical protein
VIAAEREVARTAQGAGALVLRDVLGAVSGFAVREDSRSGGRGREAHFPFAGFAARFCKTWRVAEPGADRQDPPSFPRPCMNGTSQQP